MKKLALITLMTISTAAFAQSADRKPNPPPHNDNEPCYACEGAGVYVGAALSQSTTLQNAVVMNIAEGGHGRDEARAVQNIASNTYGVKIGAATNQVASFSSTLVLNKADGSGAVAGQNLASNIGAVHVASALNQAVSASRGSAFINVAKKNARAVQNVSTNNACEDCL
jgi:hypothetical protein